jgi:hypothetical protein
MKGDNRERKRQWIRRVVEFYFGVDDGYNDCLTDDANAKALERINANVIEFLLDKKDADLKDEAFYGIFQQICEKYPEPKELTWEDFLFISKVTGRSPEQVKESIERNF